MKTLILLFLFISTAHPAYLDGVQGITADSASTASTKPVLMSGKDSTNTNRAIKVSNAGVVSVDSSATTQPVSIADIVTTASASGASSTAARQDTGNTSLASLDTKSPALVGGRVPVDGSGVTQPVSIAGTVTTTGGLTDAQLRASAVSVSNASTISIDAKTPSLVGGKQPVVISNSDSTIIVSGIASVGVAPTLNPVSVSGVDAGGLKRHLLTLTDGTVQVSSSTAATAANQISGLAKTKLVDASGNTIASLDDGTGSTKALGVALMATNFVYSASNFSTQSVSAAGTLVSACESAVPQQAISALGASDVAGTLFIGQYIDSSCTKGKELSYTISAGITNGFVRSFVNNANYVKWRFVNGASPATNANVDIAYGTLDTATQLGNKPISLEEIGGNTFAQGTRVSASSISMTPASDAVFSATRADITVTGQSAQTATVNNILTTTSGSTATDALGYHAGSVQVVSTGSGGTFIFEGSNDNTNFQAITVQNQGTVIGSSTNSAITANSSQIIYVFAINYRYLRLRIATTITGGSIQAFTKLSQDTFTNTAMTFNQNTAANLNATVSGTVTSSNTAGTAAHSAASSGNNVRVGGRVITTLDTTLAQGDSSDIAITTAQQLLIKPFATRENDWNTAASTSGSIVNTTAAVTLKAAGAASIRNCLTQLNISHDLLGAVSELVVRDGAAGTVVYRHKLQTPAIENFPVSLPTPICGTAATLMEIATLTAVSGGVYVNAQGYQGF